MQFEQVFPVLNAYNTAPSGQGFDIAVPFQFLIGPAGGDDAHRKIRRQGAYSRQQLPLGQGAAENLPLNLLDDLFIQGRGRCGINQDCHVLTSLCIFDIHSIYWIYTVVNP